jgi:serine/threonine-protein kinase
MQGSADAPQELHERFLRESRAAAQLRHPGIVAILDFGVDAARQPYMVMELLSGPSLAEEIALQAPMPPARVAAIVAEVSAALQLAHDRGITHRDLKPANIVLHRYGSGERAYKVIDFGLAVMKSARDSTRLTAPNLFIGTMAYAAPEQIRGEPITPAADVHAVGVITYEMLTGVRPFDAEDRITLLNQVLTVRPVTPTERHGALPQVDDAAARADKEPAERWPSMAAFARRSSSGGRPGAGPRHQPAGALSRAQLGRGRWATSSGHAPRLASRRHPGAEKEEPHWDRARAVLLEDGPCRRPSSLLQVLEFGEDDARFVVTDLIDG